MYSKDYYFNLLRIHSHTAKEINTIRWNWVECCSPKTVLDYGSGVGWFKAYAPEEIKVDNYDIMSVPQTGITLEKYDLITFWDVIEHIKYIPNLKSIFDITNYIAISVPIVPNKFIEYENCIHPIITNNTGIIATSNTGIKEWKHYKPGEHFHYFTNVGIVNLFNDFGFRLLKEGKPECPPREDIFNYLFKRRQ